MKNPLDRFELKAIKAAKVSEISESTAASGVAASDRVNFHIGNPVQDVRLHQLYFSLVSDIETEEKTTVEKIVDNDDSDKNKDYISLLKRCIETCSPYMPRGGYASKNPHKLIGQFKEWLNTGQNEPLDYNFGESGGQREVILANGGIWENLRALFFLISHYLINLPVKIFLSDISLPAYLKNFTGLDFEDLSVEKTVLVEQINRHFVSQPQQPTFIILGSIPDENVRRQLRRISLDNPLFFVEVNNALNHDSIQREAKMLNRVLRIITPAAISPRLANISVNFIAGNADFLRVLENVQFELKGTPSAAEVELLSYLLQKGNPESEVICSKFDPEDVRGKNIKSANSIESNLSGLFKVANQISQTVQQKAVKIENLISSFSRFGESLDEKVQKISVIPNLAKDRLTLLNTKELLDYFFANIDQAEINTELAQSFLSAFLNHHPEYQFQNCTVVSGSARTALSLLGFHCGIDEIITPDLSWTYEHCFAKTVTIPLAENLDIDSEAVIDVVRQKLSSDQHWNKKAAVVLNNPHNASGQIFDEEAISFLLLWLLEKDVYVIDDLSYQNVVPSHTFQGPKTLRQLANELIKNGYLSKEKANKLITVHSLSKTDCFAGARLAVIELPCPKLFEKFDQINRQINPNSMAILLSYLFYRNYSHQVNQYWQLRNQIFEERMLALEEALNELPAERNPFEISISRPVGSMYPHMKINKLPNGISLDWLSSGLATKGIGLIPLSVFARTSKGYDLARKTFRLTLGGETNPQSLKRKTRRMLIDLNRMIAEEEASYNVKKFKSNRNYIKDVHHIYKAESTWAGLADHIFEALKSLLNKRFQQFFKQRQNERFISEFLHRFLPERLAIFKQRFYDKNELLLNIAALANSDKRSQLTDILKSEFYKDNLQDRIERFRQRLYDRTVHPTQMYALPVELIFEQIIDQFIHTGSFDPRLLPQLLKALIDEYLGLNVAINSLQEADELVADLKMMIMAEEYMRLNIKNGAISFLSFWGDWDGSTRPSGQGHRLVMAVVIENVNCLANLLKTLLHADTSIKINPDILNDLDSLQKNNRRSLQLSNKINALTNELEKRYFKVLPIDEKVNQFRKMGQRFGLVKDPISRLWQHNDKLEKEMLELRIQRGKTMEYYFALNKRLRKTLHSLLPQIEKNLHIETVAYKFGSYRDLLKRFVLTPRIHQKIITSTDQFTIDTTLQNITEINRIAGKYGNPGMVLSLQISMTTEPESIIDLDRKARAKREECIRENPDCMLPSLGLIPLFEDQQTVSNIESFLDRLWEYSQHSQLIDQETSERFAELIYEVFIAGSDLSQQVGQTASLALFKEAKFRAIKWFAERGLVEKVRVKLGSGEPAQRQGGYYEKIPENAVFRESEDARQRLINNIKESTFQSTHYAKSPLRGVLSGGDLRTFQSTVSEKIRMLPMDERAQLMFHLNESQRFYRDDIIRASEPLLDTRLQYQTQGIKELEAIIQDKKDEYFSQFIEISTRNFREILYGREEDVLGIHIISYFISRAIPALRDRPTIRPSREMSYDKSQKVIERIARTLPLSQYGSLLRAIGHNRAQTMVLGINQLSTGLFRTCTEFVRNQNNDNEGRSLLSDRILPQLPVYDLLKTIRLYHDRSLYYIRKMESTFPAGNASFVLLQEDNDAIESLIILLQKELLRRYGLDVSDFFNSKGFLPQLLPTIQPELAVLLQPDIFNKDLEKILSAIGGKPDEAWVKEVEQLLQIPREIQSYREKIWELIEEAIYQQIESFVHLSLAVYKVYQGTGSADMVFSTEPGKVMRLSAEVKDLLRRNKDDSMRQFLVAAVHYLTKLPETMSEIPIDIIRTLRDVERIVKIEEQAFTKKEQDLIRFYTLKIARLCGENG